MNQEEKKQLLSVDLCDKLLYKVKVLVKELKEEVGTLVAVSDKSYKVEYSNGSRFVCPSNVEIKPYLRTMSSMTEKEKAEFDVLMNLVEEKCINAYGKRGILLLLLN